MSLPPLDPGHTKGKVQIGHGEVKDGFVYCYVRRPSICGEGGRNVMTAKIDARLTWLRDIISVARLHVPPLKGVKRHKNILLLTVCDLQLIFYAYFLSNNSKFWNVSYQIDANK